MPSSKPVVVLQLTNAGRKYSLRGDMGHDNVSHEPAFRYETNIDARALSIFQSCPFFFSVKFHTRGSVRGSRDPIFAT